jgi:hypothetical protein
MLLLLAAVTSSPDDDVPAPLSCGLGMLMKVVLLQGSDPDLRELG